ncbi:MAG: LysE family transporter [Methanobacteriota archaeon]
MITEVIFLLGLGFIVGLSGALIPGPLLVYTINESLKKGGWTGVKVIVGHMLVEVAIIMLIAVGLSSLISSPRSSTAISLVGGAMLIYMGVRSFTDAEVEINAKKTVSYGLIAGGSFFTAFNPSFPLWWATAGIRLLMEGYFAMGFFGAFLVVVGHWIADLGWYALVSYTTASQARILFERGWYKKLRTILSITLMLIGLYFIYSV